MGSSGANHSKPNSLMALVRMRMCSESSRGLTESASLGGEWAESSPEFAQSSASDAARDIVSSKSSSELTNETMPLAPEEGQWSSRVKNTWDSAHYGERGMQVLGRGELATALLLRPVTPLFLPSLFERGRELESVRGRIALFKESDP